MNRLKIIVVLTIISHTMLFSQSSGEVRKLYYQALQALGRGEIELAYTNFTNILNIKDQNRIILKPFIAKSYYFLGEIYFLKEDFDNAILNYRKVLEKFPREEIYRKAFYKLGRTLIIAERLAEGIPVLEEFIAKYFTDEKKLIPSSYYWLAKAYLKRGEKEKALSFFNKILYEFPDSAFAYEARQNINSLGALENNKIEISKISSEKNEAELLKEKEKNIKLQKEKELLDKISKLLEIKEKLLEIKLNLIEEFAKEKEEIDEN
jgi:TolA-binding protein